MPTKIDFLIAKVRAYQQTFEKLDSKTKAGMIPSQLGENFNKLLQEIAKESPNAAPELPTKLYLFSKLNSSGLCDVSYASLDIYVGQVLGVLEVLKAGN
jgi:hypothetical protein